MKKKYKMKDILHGGKKSINGKNKKFVITTHDLLKLGNKSAFTYQ